MKPDPSKICFGLSEDLDKKSMATFLQIVGQQMFSELLADRLSSEEIIKLADEITGLMHKHLSEKEYHTYFLGESDHHHHGE